MKHLITFIMAICLIFPLYGQQDSLAISDSAKILNEENINNPAIETSDTVKIGDSVKIAESSEKTSVTLGQNEILIVEENGDTTRVKLGKKGISIVEGKEGTSINIVEMEDDDNGNENTNKKKKKFKPHYAGIELGLNNFLTPDFNMNLPPDQQFMDLNTARSWNWNINFIDYGFGFGTSYAGIATGMGFEFSWYAFNNQNSIQKDDNGVTVEFIPEYADNLTHSRFFTSYLTVPLILEFQIPVGKNRIHLSGGLIGGAKLWSNTRMKYRTPGSKAKSRIYGDYNLTPLRYGTTFRIGYENINIYANYYLSSLFKENRGPELYPFAAGLSFTW